MLPPASHRWPTVSVVLAVVIVAAGLRLWAAMGDLWLDEVWSIQLAEQITAPWQIALLRSDNNHMLNTAYVAWLGSDRPLLTYRLLSIIAGTLAVVVAGGIGAERGRVEQRTAMVLVGTSYLMVHYSSEARGYALVILGALSAYWCLLRFLRTRQTRFALGFAGCASVGFLAHPIFLFFYVAAGYWSVVALHSASTPHGSIQSRPSRRAFAVFQPLFMLHLLPTSVAVVLYLINYRDLELGGGPTYDLGPLLVQTGSLAIGGPSLGYAAIMGAIAVAFAVAGSLWVLRCDGDDQWKVLAICVVLPLVAVSVTQPPFLFVRYFLIAIVFVQLLLAFGLAWLFRQGRPGRVAYATLVTLFVVVNGAHLSDLYQSRRGHYLAALQFVADADPSRTVTIGSNHDHGTSMLVNFYRKRISPARKIEYRRVDNWPVAGPNWLILHHDPSRGPANYPPAYAVDGKTYELSKVFNSSILSGWQWFCYRNRRQEAPLAGKSASEMLNVTAVADR